MSIRDQPLDPKVYVVSFEQTIGGKAASAGAVSEHPAVQAAVSEFSGEVVAVRPRLPEGESQ